MLIVSAMKPTDEKIPDPKELEKEIGDFLTKKFGSTVKIVSPVVVPHEMPADSGEPASPEKRRIDFDLKPQELIAHLDQYIIRQDDAKAILATKICTHYNRIKRVEEDPKHSGHMVGHIKNNVLMIGPTGVGKTYMIKLIAKKIGVPFVKGDATKFSETGYVGADVEDLVRDLVREADDDIEMAQHGIIYIDEIDKIASSHNLIGADVSRTGVQRGLLKPLEETEVDLKVPHDPISMIQEIERFRKTGQRDRRSVNTKNILFIVSGAFSDLPAIIKKRMVAQGIGFGARIQSRQQDERLLEHVKAEDLIAFGFESEFTGRLPVRAVFESLTQDDLFDILKNPNNPIILGKKLDFDAYGISIKFDARVLKLLAQRAFHENTGARGLVSAVENALLPFEKQLPSTEVVRFPVTERVIHNPHSALEELLDPAKEPALDLLFDRLRKEEVGFIREYIVANRKNLEESYGLNLTSARIDNVGALYCRHIMEIEHAITTVKSLCDEIKNAELLFFKDHDINIVLEEDAIDHIISRMIDSGLNMTDLYRQFVSDFQYGLKLVREKTGQGRFFITRQALIDPEKYIAALIQQNALDSAPHSRTESSEH